MTLRLRRHFSTQIAFYAAPTPALICPGLVKSGHARVGDRISTASGSERVSINKPIYRDTLATARGTDPAHSQEQGGEKKQDDHRWKIQIPVSVEGQKSQGAQQKQDEPLLRIKTELVQIDAVVTDKQGKLARDLKRADFELFDDGKKQEITHFAIGTAEIGRAHV